MSRFLAAFLRHGEYAQPERVPSAHLPYPLTREGEVQAREAGQELVRLAHERDWVFDREVDCSQMLRAWQTAEVVAAQIMTRVVGSVEVTAFEALAERSVGAVANLTVDQIAAVVERDPRCGALPADWKTRADYVLPFQGAESFQQAGERVARHMNDRMNELATRASRPTVKVFVGHGGSFRHAASAWGILKAEEVPRLSVFHCRPLIFEWRANGQWHHVHGEWKTRAHGDRDTSRD